MKQVPAVSAFSDDDLQRRGFQRALLLRKAAKAYLAAHERATDAAIGALNLGIATDEDTRQIAGKFFTVSVDLAAVAVEQNSIRQQAYALLPQGIQTSIAVADTCACVLHQVWDEADDTTKQTFHAKPCQAHQGLPDIATIHDRVMSEVTRKNAAVAEVMAQLPNRPDLTAADLEFGYDQARVLHLRHPSFSAGEKTKAKNACDARFGAGLVVID